jgi:hypothetical protein
MHLQPNAFTQLAIRIGCVALLAVQAAGAAGMSDTLEKIREEGLNRSQVMETLSYLTEVIGPRLTASPGHKRANEWTRDKLKEWGCSNADLEAFGPFGRGWSLDSFSIQIVRPQAIPLVGFPAAWSAGLEKTLCAPVVYVDASNTSQLEAYEGKLDGAVVLCGSVRELRPRYEPLATRMNETNLLRLANAGAAGAQRRNFPRGGPDPEPVRSARPLQSTTLNSTNVASRGTNAAPRTHGGRGMSRPRLLAFLTKEKAALAVFPSYSGDGGILFVTGAMLPASEGSGRPATNQPRAWSTNAPVCVPQVTLAAEDYNRLVRMIKHGEKLSMQVELRVRFHDEDLMAYNTVAEIPGTDLKDEIVMVGGHLDSWHSSPGATDNGIGVAVSMEAMRIIKALDLKPRRTIRIGLWAGEEQGLLGSKNFVARHFGYWTNQSVDTTIRSPKDGVATTTHARVPKTPFSTRKLVRKPEYEKFSVYFNFDNGGGRIRGVYLQGNEGARPVFRAWLDPFRDLQADTLTAANTSGTDHLSFDAIGLPAFQFIQDPIEYNTRTHHSNQDTFDRVQPEDAKQAAVIMAALAYQAAMEEERLPRKPLRE